MLQDSKTQNPFFLLGNLVFVKDKAKVENRVFFSYFGVSSFQQEMKSPQISSGKEIAGKPHRQLNA